MKEHGHEQRHHGFAGALERRRARGGQRIFRIEEQGRRDLVASVRKAQDPDKSLLDYRKEDFDLGAAMPVIAAAMKETKHGRGVAVVRGLPRDELDEKSFELMTGDRFATGVARPQGKATHYVSAVRDVGTAYRTGTGRGYSSNAELDFHTDSSDVVFPELLQQGGRGRHEHHDELDQRL